MVTEKLPNRLSDARDILTVDEAAHLLRLGRHAMYEALRRGDVPSVRIGRRLLIAKADIQRLLGIANDDEKEDQCEDQ